MKPHHLNDILFTEDQIRQRLYSLVDEMSDELLDRDLIIVGVLRGSFIFLADLVRELFRAHIHPRIDFISVQSYYSGTDSSGSVELVADCMVDVKDTHVLIIDDILDSGRTLSGLSEHLMKKGAKQVNTCVLLDKPARRAVSFEADHVGFTIDDAFVAGYGLDYDGRYRELPYISAVTFTG